MRPRQAPGLSELLAPGLIPLPTSHVVPAASCCSACPETQRRRLFQLIKFIVIGVIRDPMS